MSPYSLTTLLCLLAFLLGVFPHCQGSDELEIDSNGKPGIVSSLLNVLDEGGDNPLNSRLRRGTNPSVKAEAEAKYQNYLTKMRSDYVPMEPQVLCDHQSMMVKFSLSDFDHINIIAPNGEPVDLNGLPKYCNIDVRVLFNEVVVVAGFPGCFVKPQRFTHALDVSLYGQPIQLTCPRDEPPVIICKQNSMEVLYFDDKLKEKFFVDVRGHWTPLKDVPAECGIGVSSSPGFLCLSIAYSCSCGMSITNDAYVMKIRSREKEMTLSCAGRNSSTTYVHQATGMSLPPYPKPCPFCTAEQTSDPPQGPKDFTSWWHMVKNQQQNQNPQLHQTLGQNPQPHQTPGQNPQVYNDPQRAAQSQRYHGFHTQSSGQATSQQSTQQLATNTDAGQTVRSDFPPQRSVGSKPLSYNGPPIHQSAQTSLQDTHMYQSGQAQPVPGRVHRIFNQRTDQGTRLQSPQQATSNLPWQQVSDQRNMIQHGSQDAALARPPGMFSQDSQRSQILSQDSSGGQQTVQVPQESQRVYHFGIRDPMQMSPMTHQAASMQTQQANTQQFQQSGRRPQVMYRPMSQPMQFQQSGHRQVLSPPTQSQYSGQDPYHGAPSISYFRVQSDPRYHR